jgi:hypothetical protein
MADNSLLSSVLAGQDPLSPQILQAIHNENARNYVQDPNNWQGGGLFGGLARMIAGAAVPNNAPTVADITQQRAAARPDQAALLASDNPFAAIAANPSQYSPLAQAMVLNGATPQSAAETRLNAANAALAGLNVSGFQQAQQGAGGGAPAISAPASKNIAPASSGNPAVFGAGRYPAPGVNPPTAQVAPASAAPPDPVAAYNTATPQQKKLMLADPRYRSMVLQAMRARAAQSASAVTPSAP